MFKSNLPFFLPEDEREILIEGCLYKYEDYLNRLDDEHLGFELMDNLNTKITLSYTRDMAVDDLIIKLEDDLNELSDEELIKKKGADDGYYFPQR